MTATFETAFRRVLDDEAFRSDVMGDGDALAAYGLTPAQQIAIGELSDRIAKRGGELPDVLSDVPVLSWWF